MIREKMFRIGCVVLLYAGGVLGAYIEGTDTTDVNGYGLDSAFRVWDSNILSQTIATYCFDSSTTTGYFNYAFDDIKLAPSFFPFFRYSSNVYSCFVIQNKDSTYSKIQLLQLISGNRYLYKYGTNTTPNNRMLTSPTYDSSILYKPNNFRNTLGILYPPQYDTIFWDAPLPNNNHLLGYIFYAAKGGVTIDTTAPINIAQWDSIAFVNTTWLALKDVPNGYFNLVAVYTEGKSDFLSGWTAGHYGLVGVKQGLSGNRFITNTIKCQKTYGGFLITFQLSQKAIGSPSLFIYNVNGEKVAGFPDLKTNKVFWKTTDRNIPEGQYIVTLELPDKSLISSTLVFLSK